LGFYGTGKPVPLNQKQIKLHHYQKGQLQPAGNCNLLLQLQSATI